MADNRDKVTPELLEKAKACQSEEEVIALLQEEGVEIPDEALDGMASGGYWCGGGGGICQNALVA